MTDVVEEPEGEAGSESEQRSNRKQDVRAAKSLNNKLLALDSKNSSKF
jgi:hypothetical protein